MKNKDHISRKKEKELEQMSPFEIKNTLISLADVGSHKTHHSMLNAGRGNPNWICTEAREAFFTLGSFALKECRRTMNYKAGLAGIPEIKGIADRFKKFLKNQTGVPGLELLEELYQYGLQKHQFNADAFVHELAEGVIGDQYPVPDRMLKHSEAIVHDYLIQEMCNNDPPRGNYDLFATEGGTAAMCYIFDSLMQNFLIKKGDKIALFIPVFTPYIEIPELDRYDFEVIHINAKGMSSDGQHSWEYPDEELDSGIPGYRARIRPIVSRITIHWPSFYNVVTGKTLALPNLIALQHIPLSPAGVIAKRPAPIALPNSCAAEWRMAPDAVFSPYASVRYFTPHMVHSQYNLL